MLRDEEIVCLIQFFIRLIHLSSLNIRCFHPLVSFVALTGQLKPILASTLGFLKFFYLNDFFVCTSVLLVVNDEFFLGQAT